MGERADSALPNNPSLTTTKAGPEAPCVVHIVTIVELGPEDLYRLAWAFTAAWINGEEVWNRAVIWH